MFFFHHDSPPSPLAGGGGYSFEIDAVGSRSDDDEMIFNRVVNGNMTILAWSIGLHLVLVRANSVLAQGGGWA